MKNNFILFLIFICVFITLSCEEREEKDSASKANSVIYIDGKYQATSLKDEWGGNAKVELTIQNGKIVSCTFSSYEADGKLKDADYGKVDGEIKNMGLYKIAQNAILQSSKYPNMLLESQDIDVLDAIAGATVSFNLFKDAVKQIMSQACKGDIENCNDNK